VKGGARAAIAVLALIAAPASAADGEVTVTWTAPPQCPSGRSVEEAVHALLASSTHAAGDAAHVEARVTVTRSGEGRYRAEVKTRSQGVRGARTFHAATCAALAEATALLLALMVDPTVIAATADAMAPPPERPSPLPPLPSPPAIAVPERPAPSPAPAFVASASRPWRLAPRLEATAAFDVGTLPRAATGVEVGAGVEYGAVLLTLDVGVWPSPISPGDSTGSLTLTTGQLSLCGRPLSHVPLWACGGQSYLHLAGTFPDGVDTAQHQTGDAAALVGGVLSEPRLGPIGLVLRAEGVVFYRRPEFLGESAGLLFRPAPAAFRGFVGLALHFL
jgi:hypothetical protein